MKTLRTGIILNTENYEACVAFYRGLLDLRVMFVKEDDESHLTCLDFGGSYLMIEEGGKAMPGGKSASESPHKLRFNVPDIYEAQAKLIEFGIEARVLEFSWGRVINIHDPDGNRVGIRDEESFEH